MTARDTVIQGRRFCLATVMKWGLTDVDDDPLSLKLCFNYLPPTTISSQVWQHVRPGLGAARRRLHVGRRNPDASNRNRGSLQRLVQPWRKRTLQARLGCLVLRILTQVTAMLYDPHVVNTWYHDHLAPRTQHHGMSYPCESRVIIWGH